MFMNWLLGSEILAFVIIIVFAAIDFWTVKNVTGRLLVGLRWWSEIDESGKEQWIFESCDDNKLIGKTDSLVFWMGLYLAPVVWCLFAFMDFFTLKIFWLNVCIICIILSSANVVGYYKC
jgi:hypothetical protein